MIPFQLKHRMIGVIFFIALAVIVLPPLFSRVQHVPLLDRQETVQLSVQPPPAPLAPAMAIGPTQAHSEAWTIQVGTFTNQKNAETLVVHLQQQGFIGYLQPFTQQGKPASRVLVGPMIHRQEAAKVLEQLGVRMKLQGIITEYHL